MPGIPSLKSLHLINIDPLCYPDDPSLLLVQSKNLTTLKLEWSPRMRREREPSVSLQNLFNRCLRANHKIPLKHLGLKNLYARKDVEMDQAINQRTVETVSFINCVDPADQATVFIDRTWMLHAPPSEELFENMKSLRIDRLDVHHGQPLANFSNFESIFLVSPERSPSNATSATNGNGHTNGHVSASASASPSPSTPNTPSTTEHERTMVTSGSAYIAAITTRHGSTIRKLLLSNLWALSAPVVMNIVKSCPNLEQLGLAIESNDVDILEAAMPFAKNLKALRLLVRENDETWRKIESVGDEIHCYALGQKCAKEPFRKLRWLGMGPKIYELRETVMEEGKPARRVVRPVTIDEVKHIEIWSLDNLDL
jgi:hypothetical protein